VQDFFSGLVVWIDSSVSDVMQKKVFRHVVAYGGSVEKDDLSICNLVVSEAKQGWIDNSKTVVAPNYIMQCHAKQKLL
jgi:hypothetical protein